MHIKAGQRLSMGALVVALAMAACGGDDDGSGDAVAQADEICGERAEQIVATVQEHGTPTSIEEDAQLSQALLEPREEAVARLRELTPPEDMSSEWEALVANEEATFEVRRRQVQALRAEDTATLEAFGPRINELSESGDRIAEELGADVCAGVLPDDEARAAEAVVEEVATTTDPRRVCDELVTENYLEIGFGGDFEQCARFQEDAENTADSIEVRETTGVSGLVADVVVNEADGVTTRWTLFYEDGDWKVFEIIEVPEA